jgi:hypothetical protein
MTMPFPRTLTTIVAALLLAAGLPSEAHAAGGSTPVGGTMLQLDRTFEYPNGVATDKRAHVYITDREDNRVQVWGY